mmetsp:Transcript_24316/g.65945  ORF Transcript_24316/g.65945 Transcript_24316/m.65945 type:complete len:266 (-) Transcript_24316:1438-2235(-)
MLDGGEDVAEKCEVVLVCLAGEHEDDKVGHDGHVGDEVEHILHGANILGTQVLGPAHEEGHLDGVCALLGDVDQEADDAAQGERHGEHANPAELDGHLEVLVVGACEGGGSGLAHDLPVNLLALVFARGAAGPVLLHGPGDEDLGDALELPQHDEHGRLVEGGQEAVRQARGRVGHARVVEVLAAGALDVRQLDAQGLHEGDVDGGDVRVDELEGKGLPDVGVLPLRVGAVHLVVVEPEAEVGPEQAHDADEDRIERARDGRCVR